MVKINGEEENLAGLNLAKCIEEHGYTTKWIVVEINEEIIPKEKYKDITIKDNDVIEVVSFVGGG